MQLSKLILSLLLSIALCVVVSACQNVTPQETTQNNEVVTHTVPTVPVNDVSKDITQEVLNSAALHTAALADNQANLLTNSGFEQGTEGWYACNDDQNILLTNQSYNDAQALELTRDCFYQSVFITDISTLSVSCYVDVVAAGGWTGLGLSISDENWQRLADAPVQTIVGSGYREYGTSLLQESLPTGSTGSHATLWLYSDSKVNVDDCALFEGELGIPEENLLNNADFREGQANWSACGDESLITAEANTLITRDGACVYQTVNAREDLTYILTCKGRVTTSDTWNTLILSFLDENWTTIEQANLPVKRNVIREHILSLRAPVNSRYVAVLFYSEGEAIYDKCDLSVDDEGPEVENLIKNGGFEEGLNHWELCGDIDFVSDSSKAYQGDQAAFFNAPRDSEDCIQQTFYAPEGNKSYIIDCQIATYDSTREGVDAVDDGLKLLLKTEDGLGSGTAGAPLYRIDSEYEYTSLTGGNWGVYVQEPMDVTFTIIGSGAIVDSCAVVRIRSFD